MRLLDARHSEIEADFQRYYRLNLGDLFVGRLSLRRFAVLVENLPAGCATWRAQGGDLARSDETRAALLIRHAVQVFQQGFGKKPQDVPMPEPPAWGHLEKAAEERQTASRRMQKFMERHKNK